MEATISEQDLASALADTPRGDWRRGPHGRLRTVIHII